MACPQRSGNTIHFTIKDYSTATVIVCFTGSKRKQVNVDWGNGESTSWELCDPDIFPGISYNAHLTNSLKMDLNATVKVYYDGTECAETPSPWEPASTGTTLVDNCNPGFNPISVNAWSFLAPDGNDTVQITVVLEDNGWTGEG